MRRVFALLLILHGLAHTVAGMWVASLLHPVVATLLWEGAAVGFFLAAGGVLGFAPLNRHVVAFSAVAAACSVLMLIVSPSPVFMPGIALDVAIVALVLSSSHEFRVARPIGRVTAFVFSAFTIYTALVIGTRPWMLAWGATSDERNGSLTGDPAGVIAHYKIDHGVTVNAPADSVWPWVAQLGQDRGGFYSYDWLERAVGDRIYNADRIVPEWQVRKVGDTVRAIQPGYMGGILDSNPGWKITEFVPGRAMVLEGWGAFVVEPIDNHRSRVRVRTRGEGQPSFTSLSIAPFSLLAFEPAHFIMERRMLLGIKERAEDAYQTTAVTVTQ